MNETITLDGVRKSFGTKTVLGGIKLNIAEGELFGLLGPSGAGKTTLIKILTGQLDYDGSARLWDEECSHIAGKNYKKLGMVLDNCGIYERLSAIDNLMVFARIKGVKRKDAVELLKKVGLGDDIKTPAIRMSKGMKQRLQIARAMLGNPRLIFLDEPTSGLDPTNAADIHKLLLNLKNNGVTIFLTTHNMEEAHELCDNIALLNEGSIVEYGAPDELCRKYNKDKTVTVTLKDGSEEKLPCGADGAAEIADLFRRDKVEAIHSSEPSLGTVFISLTGRRLEQ